MAAVCVTVRATLGTRARRVITVQFGANASAKRARRISVDSAVLHCNLAISFNARRVYPKSVLVGITAEVKTAIETVMIVVTTPSRTGTSLVVTVRGRTGRPAFRAGRIFAARAVYCAGDPESRHAEAVSIAVGARV